MRFLVFQHIACEHPGSFREFMVEAGVNWDPVELDEGEPIPSLEGYDALIVMGGPMDVWDTEDYPWLIAEKDAIRHWVRNLARPFLGVCLGHQLLADALGGSCRKMETPDVGITEIALTPSGQTDPLFSGLEPVTPTLQWHGVEVADLPPNSAVLAKSQQCSVEAFCVAGNAYGIQGHAEVTPSTVREWGEVPAYSRALQSTLGPGALAQFDQRCAASMHAFRDTARKIFANFLSIAQD